jgi:hypothetical protein
MMLLADCGCRRSRAEAVASAPRDIISVAVVSRLSLPLATSTMAEKSRQPESCGSAYALTCAGDDGERFCIAHVPASSNKKLRVRFGKKLRREGLTCRFQDYVDHKIWLRVHRAVVHMMRMNLRPHTISHEMLRLRIDHSIFFGDQEP